MFRPLLLSALLALTACEPDPLDDGHANARTLMPTAGPIRQIDVDYSGIPRAVPCDFPAGAAPAEPLTCGVDLVLDASEGAPLPSDAVHCDYPTGDYQLLQTSGDIVIKLTMCDGGAVVVFDGNACYGAASFGDEWAVFPLPTHTIGVTGGKYLLATEDC